MWCSWLFLGVMALLINEYCYHLYHYVRSSRDWLIGLCASLLLVLVVAAVVVCWPERQIYAATAISLFFLGRASLHYGFVVLCCVLLFSNPELGNLLLAVSLLFFGRFSATPPEQSLLKREFLPVVALAAATALLLLPDEPYLQKPTTESLVACGFLLLEWRILWTQLRYVGTTVRILCFCLLLLAPIAALLILAVLWLRLDKSTASLSIFCPRPIFLRRRKNLAAAMPKGVALAELVVAIPCLVLIMGVALQLFFSQQSLFKDIQVRTEVRQTLENTLEEVRHLVIQQADPATLSKNFTIAGVNNGRGQVVVESVAPYLWKVSVSVHWGSGNQHQRKLTSLVYKGD